MRRISCLYLLVLFFVNGCQSSDERAAVSDIDNIYFLDIVSSIENKVDLNISDIASDISYIQLETTAKNGISQIRKVQFTENFIFVSDVNGLYQFTAEGRFISADW